MTVTISRIANDIAVFTCNDKDFIFHFGRRYLVSVEKVFQSMEEISSYVNNLPEHKECLFEVE